MKRWKKATPIPPEFNGFTFLFECTTCHKSVTYLGRKSEPPWNCPYCEQKKKEKA